MKTPVLRLCVSLLSVSPLAVLAAAFENPTFEMTTEPQMPAVLVMDGLREGKVVFALDIAADGRLSDWLVTAASHEALIRPCVEAVREWRFKPARIEGAPVPARIELTINLSQTGAVVSRTAADVVTDMFESIAGRRNDYEVCPASEVDRPLVATNRVSPEYARDAQTLGVSGRVRVHFYVDERGNVRLPAVPADTHPYLSSIAVEAMRGWKFEPPTRRGRPVLVSAVQEFDFGRAP